MNTSVGIRMLGIVITCLMIFGCNEFTVENNLNSIIYNNEEVDVENDGKWGETRVEVIGENIPYYNIADENTSLTFDFYRPKGIEKRLPLIIFVHSGAFITGNKKNYVITQYCKDLVRTGDFAAVIVDYRLIDFNDIGSLVSKSYTRTKLMESVGDVRTAIDYFINNGVEYNIDPNRIFLVGYSAGAIISNQIIYTSIDEVDDYIDASTIDNAIVSMASMVGMEDAFIVDNLYTYDYNFTDHIKGVVSISGAVMSHTMLDDMDNYHTPLLMIHGNEDRIVPIGNESPFNHYSDEDLEIYLPNITPASQLSLIKKFTIKKEVIGELIDMVSSPICGSRCIYDGVFKDRNIQLLEIEGGPHLFMVGENGLFNEMYLKTRKEIYKFIKDHING